MLDIKHFSGCGTALVTPFKRDGSLDEQALKRLVEYQIKEGIDFLVPCGTTGESATLTVPEHLRVIELVVEITNGRIPVFAGAGSNDTAHVIYMVNESKKLGADGILSVSPYYNKPPQEGLYQHYKTIAESVDLPIILYNVPGRTSCNIEPDTVLRLSRFKNIIGIKEASGNIAQIGALAVRLPADFKIISGDDSTTLAIMALGGVGVISVIANQAPALMKKLVQRCLKGDFSAARTLQSKLFHLMNLNFVETNPIPVKAGLAMMGLIENNLRLPLVKLSDRYRPAMEEALKKLGLIS